MQYFRDCRRSSPTTGVSVKFGGEEPRQRWRPLIVVLTEGNRRIDEMQRLIEGVFAKVLSTELKDLELNCFVGRNVLTRTPVVVEYELTEYAETLGGVLQALSEWGSKAQRDGEEKYAYAGGGCLVYVLVFSLHFCCYSNTNADNQPSKEEERTPDVTSKSPGSHQGIYYMFFI